jgi:hypothetical protein
MEQKETWFDKAKKFVANNKEEFITIATISAAWALGYSYGKSYRKTETAKNLVEFGKVYNEIIDEECGNAVVDFIKKVAPKENVKYVIERFHDASGRTYGTLEEYISDNYKLIEKED